MTDNPEPKGKGISSRFSNILRRSTRSTSDLTGIHEHDIASDYPTKIANVPNRKPVYKNPFSAIPSGGTQEAVASALAETDRISDYTLSPPPTVPLVASPPRSSGVANAGITLVISSSQESEQVRDAGAALAQLTEYTLDDEPSSSPPKITYVEEKAVSRPGSTTPTRNRTRPTERQVTPMEDWVFSSQELHWFKRLEAGGYPDNEALERCIKQLYDDTDEEKSSTNAFIQKIEKLGNQISSIAENALYNGTEAGPSRPESPMKQDEEEDTYMGEPEPGPNQPNPLTTEICWGTDAKPGEWGGYTNPPAPTHSATTDPTQAMLQAILTKMGQLDDIKSRLDKLEGKSPQVHTAQTSTSRNKHTTNPSPAPTVNSSQTRPSFANVAAKAPAKAPEVKASNIAAAIKRDIAKPAPAQSDDKNFVVRFKTLPVTQPNPESIFVAMRECLDAANRNLGKGRLTRVRWSLKASLHLSFSNNVSVTAIENAIPLLMDRLRLPEYEFGPEVPWSRLVVTNVPTGMGGSLQRMRNREELTQLLNEAFPDSAKFGSVKLTLAPDWLADPARLQAEGRHASTVSFAFEDAGGNAKSRSLTPNPYCKPALNAFATDTPNVNAEPRNPAATNADATTTRPTNTTQTTAPDASAKAKGTHANVSLENHKFTIINTYAHGKDAYKTIQHLTEQIIPAERPLILTGDFNLHHPDWALDNSKWKNRHPNQTEREFRDYAEAVEAWPNFNWEVDTPSTGRSCGSDHMAITWSIQPSDQNLPDEDAVQTPHRQIDPKREDKWVEAYANALKKFELPEEPTTAEDADLITGAILEAMSTATMKTMPDGNKKKGSGPVRSPWWNAECSGALNDLKHNPEGRTQDQLRATLRGAIRRACQNNGDRILSEIRTSKVFESLKWFQGKRRSLLPPIKNPNGGNTATHPHHKAENLAKQFFPTVNPTYPYNHLGLKPCPSGLFRRYQ
ncbi:hypothetical protein RhiXN_07123 [Rhizoctonia solani]|uniref:Endonuclease/exonuclease/phosphatase domain-containing protein n=1 Tax=Rhizoctonia solani TaxID=456999 RepID=A0A8H8P448_9AGAM|nr:uncharacterized protein RhiXN_07123 [Rhizoctonia solani]QRW25174.1 hypothetical protein RhiXN_07123 [Rhizoctonia solani]